MGNLSKEKREKMIDFLEKLRSKVQDDDEALIALGEIENEINNKKYGLVWEKHTEQVDSMLDENVPVFSENIVREIETINGQGYNFILEGDNLHSLYLLHKTSIEQFDVIYIDPPYNTGAKDWKYNNNYMDKAQKYRHSKWISMMDARMRIAKDLLKDDGVFICAIDENELGTLLLLIDDVFGVGYSVDPVVVVHNPRGIQGDNFSYVNEYAIFVYKKGYKVIETTEIKEEDIDWSPLRNWGDESERHDAANCFYPILVKNEEIIGFGDDMTNVDSFHPCQTEYDEENDLYKIWPIDIQGIERKWRYARQTVETILHLLRVKKIDGGYDIELGKNFAPYRTVWDDKKMDANEYGTQLIRSMVPSNDFTFPKSVYNVKECLRAVTLNRPNALILDYFAGSGTTGHATLMLNKELGGNRRFILCTNNDVGEKKEKEFKKLYGAIDENSTEWKEWQEKYGIASSVTYPRIKAAILGYSHKKDVKTTLFEQNITPSILKNNSKIMNSITKITADNKDKYDDIKFVVEDGVAKVIGIVKKNNLVPGLEANLKYYKTDFVSKKEEYLSEELLKHIKEMVQLKHGVKIDNKEYVLVLSDEEADNLEQCWDSLPVKALYISKNVLLTTTQNELFNSVELHIIPDYFFDNELKEVGETW